MDPKPLFSGTYSALVTPFLAEKLDLASFEHLLTTQQNLEGIVIGGTTGESPALDNGELEILTREALEQKKPSFKIIVGTGSNVTQHAVTKTQLADHLDVDAILVVAPYYNKPSQEGLFHHFSTIAQNTRKPIILYSVPSRCGIEIAVETVAKLHEKYPHIVGLKEATEQCARVDALRAALGENFSILGGNDSMTLPFMALGACGVISVASNLFPDEVQKIVQSMLRGAVAEARTLHQVMAPLFRDLFLESNPVPIKHLLARRKIITSHETRLPLVPLTPEHAQMLEATWARVSEGLNLSSKTLRVTPL
ncbi:MAG: 4-hydroxy-tetrahydrodipicolinate synthase [Puniceicoccales bacterium]|jgi:4-hydroxy-tetrahydrodipicolinate synthase|nr:4-hydroxy-tetrahydrodipicolinate synthase [Puniceicoccales bacterium]